MLKYSFDIEMPDIWNCYENNSFWVFEKKLFSRLLSVFCLMCCVYRSDSRDLPPSLTKDLLLTVWVCYVFLVRLLSLPLTWLNSRCEVLKYIIRQLFCDLHSGGVTEWKTDDFRVTILEALALEPVGPTGRLKMHDLKMQDWKMKDHVN